MGDKKRGMLAADDFGKRVATLQVAKMLGAYHEDQPAAAEIRLEDERFRPWDDFTELHGDGWHGWQVKRNRDEFDAATLEELVQGLHRLPELAAGHLAVPSLTQVRVPGSGRRSRSLQLGVLRSLCTKCRRRASGEREGENTGDEADWLGWIGEVAGLETGAASELALRLWIEVLGEEDEVRRMTQTRIPAFAIDHSAAESVLFDHVCDELVRAGHLLPDALFETLSRKVRLRPSSDSRRRARGEYLRRLVANHARRRPLHDLLRSADVVDPELTMEHVEIDVRIVSLSEERDIGDGLGNRARTLREVLVRRDAATRPDVLVLGDIGTGKTTALEQAAAALAEAAIEEPGMPLPWLVSARDLADLGDRQLGRFRELRPHDCLIRGLDTRWVYLVDGYDEVPIRERAAVDAALEALRNANQTAGTAVTSRATGFPPRAPSTVAYKIIPWTTEERDRFATRWAASSGDGTDERDFAPNDDMFSNPLTATLYLAFAKRAGSTATRAHLFALLVEHVFDMWASGRPALRQPWHQVAPIYQALARTMLSRGEVVFSRAEIERALAGAAPDQIARLTSEATEELGLLVRTADGRFEFAFRAIAEHLAGAHMADDDDLDAVARDATAAWAEEPARHCIGLLAFRGRAHRAHELLQLLSWRPGNEIVAGHAFRHNRIAALAAADIGEVPAETAGVVADAVLFHLGDGSSNWRPNRAAELVRSLISGGGPFSILLRDRTATLQSIATDRLALANVEHSLRELHHRESVVRLAAVRRLGQSPDEPDVRQLLLAELLDAGTLDPSRWSVAVEAGLALRRATRDAQFEDVSRVLHHLLATNQQIGSGAAAIALHPSEAAADDLRRALSWLSEGYLLPAGITDERDGHSPSETSGDRQGSRSATPFLPPTDAELESAAARFDVEPSGFIRTRITLALGSSALDLAPSARARSIELAATNDPFELEILCERALHDPEPFVAALGRIGVARGALVDEPSRRGYLRFTPRAASLLKTAARRQPAIVPTLCDLWIRTRGLPRPIADFPASALEDSVANGEPVPTEVYTEWLRVSFGHSTPLPQIPVRLRAVLAIQQAAKEITAGTLNSGPHMVGLVLPELRPFWLRHVDSVDTLTSWLRTDDDERVVAAVRAFGPADLPSGAEDVVASRLERDIAGNDVPALAAQIGFIVATWATSIPLRCRDRLLKIARSESPSRFAAGAAVFQALPAVEATDLATELVEAWPGANWSFYYGRHDTVWHRLIEAAPLAWARRCTHISAGDGVELAARVVEHIPLANRVDLIGEVLRASLRWPIPWMMLGSWKLERILDRALELAHDAGVGEATFRGWLRTPGA